MTFVCLLLILLGWYKFVKGNIAISLIIAVFFFSSFFSLAIFQSVSLKGYDLGLAYCVGLMLFQIRERSGYFSTKDDFIAKAVVWLELYLFVRFVATIILGEETFDFALKVYRNQLFYFLYFLLRAISPAHYIKAFKYLFYISLVLGVFFYLQLGGLHLLSGGDEMTFTGSGFERMRNIPVTTVLVTVYIFLSNMKNRTKYLLLIFWAGIIVLSQHRGLMISLIVAIPLCLFLKKSYKKVFNIISMFLVAGIAFSPIIIWRFSQQGSGESSLTKEISEGLNMRSSKNAEVDGTFTFRTFMILERIEWMEGHPMNLLFGNGTIHEDSKKTASKFNWL